MREFKYGVLIEDGIVQFRSTDLYFSRGLNEPTTWASYVIDKELFKNGSIGAEEAIGKLKNLKEDILKQLEFYENFFETAKELTPEWLDEHADDVIKKIGVGF